MIITRSPFRMSFFGGGTDYPPFFEEHGGSVLSTTFDKYCYTTVRHLPPFFDYRNQLTYSVIERVVLREEIRHPMVREAMKWLDMHELCIALLMMRTFLPVQALAAAVPLPLRCCWRSMR